MWQNVTNKGILTWFKLQQKSQAILEYGFSESYKPSFSSLLSNDERLREIHIISIENLILGVNSVMVSYLIHYDS